LKPSSAHYTGNSKPSGCSQCRLCIASGSKQFSESAASGPATVSRKASEIFDNHDSCCGQWFSIGALGTNSGAFHGFTDGCEKRMRSGICFKQPRSLKTCALCLLSAFLGLRYMTLAALQKAQGTICFEAA
jgi:hypothetical protein